jgi:hypothetical protein
MQSMSPALRDLEQVLLEGQIAHGDHPVLSMCAANTVIAVDDAGQSQAVEKAVGGTHRWNGCARDGNRGGAAEGAACRGH